MADWLNSGFRMNDKNLSTLYADDIVLLEHDYDELQSMAEDLAEM